MNTFMYRTVQLMLFLAILIAVIFLLGSVVKDPLTILVWLLVVVILTVLLVFMIIIVDGKAGK